jgi:alcohol dehydrogenase class IV
MILYRMPEIHTGAEAPAALERILTQLKLRRIMIVTGPHVCQSDAFRQIRQLVEQQGRAVHVYSRTQADPTLELIEEMSTEAREFEADCVIGFGGGSPLDAAKAVAVLVQHPQLKAADLVGTDQVPLGRVPLLLIPTTAGTASEVTIYSILTDTVAQIKAAICSTQIIPDYAFLIPETTYSMPPSVTAATGMDALCHACEAYLSKRQNPYSDVMALAAVRLISKYLPIAHQNPENADAREKMLLASLFAGLAFGNSSVTAIHAFAYPLGGRHHIPHGMANSLMFEPVMRHNLPGNEARMADLAEAFCQQSDPEQLVPAVTSFKRTLGLPLSLAEINIPESELEIMAESVMSVTRLLNVNPAPITQQDALRIYQEAFAPKPS